MNILYHNMRNRITKYSIIGFIGKSIIKNSVRKVRLPILMYHSVKLNNVVNQSNMFYTDIDSNLFHSHMNFLHKSEYSVISLNDLNPSIFKNILLQNKKYAILTFDDGYLDFHSIVFPILKFFSFNASVFIISDFVSNKRKYFLDNPCLNWQEVLELKENNIDIGSHTKSHPKLIYSSRSSLEEEIGLSKYVIEKNINNTISNFSYPYAFPETNRNFKALLKEILLKYNYKTCLTTNIGTITDKTDLFFLKRIPISYSDNLNIFSHKLLGYHDWLYFPQLISKHVKRYLQSPRHR